MKARFALAAACLSTFAAAQMGPGMDHRAMGPGMMGGQGMGPAMMGNHEGCGMGQEAMGGHGMTRGRGVMGGHAGALEMLDLNDEQRGRIREIHRDLQRKQYALMGSARDLRWQAQDAARTGEFDEAAARKRFESGAAIRKQMFEARLEAHRRTQEVLTKEQREQLRQGAGHGRSGPPTHR